MKSGAITILAVLMALLPGCDKSPTEPVYGLEIPTSWASSVTNTYFPLVAGTTWQYRGDTPGGVETVTIEVLPETRTVHGVTATVVRDRVYLDGSLIEDTYDWYAQDSDGNVWYLGESVKDYENGVVVSTEGSWEWGVDGALPGIIMWADPAAHVGEAYRQEFYIEEAEDWGKVIAVNQAITVPFGAFTGCITTEDWMGLEPDEPHEHKFFCPGVGQVREIVVGGTEQIDLISRSP